MTEVLITGYEHGKPVCAITLEAGSAQVTLTNKADDDETVVEAAWEQATQAFAGVRDVVRELTAIPVA